MNRCKQGIRSLHHVIAAALLLAAPAALAMDSERHQYVGGMDVYLGVVPSQMAMHHADLYNMKLGKRHVYHVLVALFDGKTGKRITDARVQATITDHALTKMTKMLKPLHMDNAMSYSHFFRMDIPGRYSITIEIQRPEISHTIVRVDFIYQRPKD